MAIEDIARHFERIGAQAKIRLVPKTQLQNAGRRWQRRVDNPRLTLDVIESQRQADRFVLRVREDLADTVELQPLDVQPGLRHLLLLTRVPNAQGEWEKRKYLCGHDERHWFVAGVPEGGAYSVLTAMEALKPALARESQLQAKLRRKALNQRWNAGFIRQGEWFFVPRPHMTIADARLIFQHEPIRRGRGKAHMVEELYRAGGELVHVSDAHRNGLTQAEYEALIRRKPEAQNQRWVRMRRNMQVFARGWVRHPDHATITLPGWHEVCVANERFDEVVVFLD